MDVLMPQLGETVAEGKITKWFKSAGEPVKPGDNLFEIETDKVSMEVPSTTTGVLSEIRVSAGDIAPVGAVVGGDRGWHKRGAKSRRPRLRRPTSAGAHRRSSPRKRQSSLASRGPPRWTRTQRRSRSSSIRSSKCARPNAISVRRGCPAARSVTPLARRLAAENGIDLSTTARLRPAWPHCRARYRGRAAAVARTRRRARGSAERRRDQGALCARQLRGSAARRHAPHHRGAADAGRDRSALLSHDRHRHRSADRAARRSQQPPRRRTRRAIRHSSSRSTISSSARWRWRCNACRRRMRYGPATAFCVSSIPISASRSRSTAD